MVANQRIKQFRINYIPLCAILLICLLVPFSVKAQVEIVPLEHHTQATHGKGQGSLARSAASSDTLLLPFWDDFSSRITAGVPDDSLWEDTGGVSITRYIAVKPPSIGVATFDGTSTNGSPHSPSPDLSGTEDILTSKPIKLGVEAVPANEQENVFLSFYWQMQGKGERPERGDSLRLYFLDSDSVMHKVWPSPINEANPDADPTTFYREIISLKEEGERLGTNFFHDGFRFQFVAETRLSGPFDLWHLDYVYLDKKTGGKEKFYVEDRALSEYQTSILRPYTALPVEQFFAAPEKYIDTSFFVTGFNVGDPNPGPPEFPENYKGENISVTMDVLVNGQPIHRVADEGSFSIEKKGQMYYETLYSDTAIFNKGVPLVPIEKLEPYKESDSIVLSSAILVLDKIAPPQPYYSLNDADTIRNVLHDYFAYDDGTAEFGLSLNGGNGIRMAYEFKLEVQDTLTHIDLYLPYYTASINGEYANLQIWKSLALAEGGGVNELVHSQAISLRNSSAPNQFESYPIDKLLILPAGTYYFGIEKQTSVPVTFGFDRNYVTNDKIFISTDMETWAADVDAEGSLMLRPGFSEKSSTVTANKPEITFPVRIFPNPNNGFFVVESEARSIELFSSQGQLIMTISQPAGIYRQEINLRGLQEGLYLLKLTYRDGIISRKILIKN